MARGSEAYLQMWERAVGVSNDACRDARALKAETVVTRLRRGTSVKDVLLRAGQPHSRLGSTFTYCSRSSKGTRVTHKVTFTSAGKVRRIT